MDTDPAPKLELRIPISPNARYVRMVRLLYRSIQKHGGPILRAARIVLSVSAERPEVDFETAFSLAPKGQIVWRWVEPELFSRLQYDGTGLDRYFVESDADVVGMLDADLLVAGDLDDVVRSVRANGSLAGFIAHISPFRALGSGESSESWWSRIYEQVGLGRPELVFEHTGWGVMCKRDAHRYCPAYLNYGVVFANRATTEAIGRRLGPFIESVDRCVPNSFFKSQVALTLAMVELGVPLHRLGLRDNFPLHVDPQAMRERNPDPNGLDSDSDVRVFHYLGNGPINKAHFDLATDLRAALGRADLNPTAAHFARLARELLD